MVTTEITAERFISEKQDTLARSANAIIAVSMVNDVIVKGGYAPARQRYTIGGFGVYSVYYEHTSKYFSTLAYLSLPSGQSPAGSDPIDPNRIYRATVVGKYPETAESMLCFTARRQRGSINRPHPLITAQMRLTAVTLTAVTAINIYPAGLVVYERGQTQVSGGLNKYLFDDGSALIESDDLAVVEKAVFAHLLKNELNY